LKFHKDDSYCPLSVFVLMQSGGAYCNYNIMKMFNRICKFCTNFLQRFYLWLFTGKDDDADMYSIHFQVKDIQATETTSVLECRGLPMMLVVITLILHISSKFKTSEITLS
jgi:hypothetical protein